MEAIERLEKIEKLALAIVKFVQRKQVIGPKAQDVSHFADTIFRLASADASFLEENIKRIEEDIKRIEE